MKIMFQAALVAAGLSGAAVAQDRMPDVAVAYGDLDLSTDAGLRSLDLRLERAVRAACPSDSGIAELQRLRSIEACRATKRQEVAGLRNTVLAQAASKGKAVASAR